MSVINIDDTLVRRRPLTVESLRMLVNIELWFHSECYGVHLRRIVMTEPDASGCNWQVEWPPYRTAISGPCRSHLSHIVERLRERYNVVP